MNERKAPLISRPQTRRVAPAHLIPQRPEPKGPNGLAMSRELSGLQQECQREIEQMMREMQIKMLEMTQGMSQRVSSLASQVARREHNADVSYKALQEALEGSRNDERSRNLELENERQRQTILTLQAELTRMRSDLRDAVGYDKSRYFRVLGEDLIDWGTEVQQLGEVLAHSECPHARNAAARLEGIGLNLGEFGENSLMYGEEAKGVAVN